MANKAIKLNDGQGNNLYPEAALSGTGFVKQADGTLIQWGTPPAVSVAGGASVDTTFNFAIPFVGTAPYTFSEIVSSDPSRFSTCMRTSTLTAGKVALHNNLSSTQEINFRYLAIGRWK